MFEWFFGTDGTLKRYTATFALKSVSKRSICWRSQQVHKWQAHFRAISQKSCQLWSQANKIKWSHGRETDFFRTIKIEPFCCSRSIRWFSHLVCYDAKLSWLWGVPRCLTNRQHELIRGESGIVAHPKIQSQWRNPRPSWGSSGANTAMSSASKSLPYKPFIKYLFIR